MITLEQRLASYAKSFEGSRYPDSIPRISQSGRWLDGTWILGHEGQYLDGTWIMGNDYKAAGTLYGSYPPRYLDRVLALCPERAGRVLHVFSGSLPRSPKYVRVDLSLDRTPAPDVYGNAMCLPFVDGAFDLVCADPPYSKDDALKYGMPMPDRRLVLHDLARVTTVGGVLVWLDVQLPMFRKDMWTWFGAITVIRSSNHRVRLASFFTRV